MTWKNMSGNFEFYPVIQHNLILSASQMEKWNFIQLSDPKLNFIPLSGKSAVGQVMHIRMLIDYQPLHCFVILTFKIA